jgi:predicted amidophosphoribosyltransferase
MTSKQMMGTWQGWTSAQPSTCQLCQSKINKGVTLCDDGSTRTQRLRLCSVCADELVTSGVLERIEKADGRAAVVTDGKTRWISAPTCFKLKPGITFWSLRRSH